MNTIDLELIRIGNRKHLYEIWQKVKSKKELTDEENTIGELMALHKEWYHFWDSTDFDYEFDPEVDEFNPFLHLIYDNVIMNQIRNKDPEQAAFTYNKLTARGYSHLDAIHEMAYVLAGEFYNIMKQKKEFNLKTYTRKLKELK